MSTDEVLSKFQSRIALITGLPLSYVSIVTEEMQVVKYESSGSSFRVHHDSSALQPRLLTALLYLTDVINVTDTTAGETWFPFTGLRNRQFTMSMDEAITKAQQLEETVINDEFRSDTIESVEGKPLYIRPSLGDAVLFFNHLPSGEIDPAAVHAGLPIPTDSVKWIANYWVQLSTKQLKDHVHSS